MMAHDFTRLQKSYLTLKKYKGILFFRAIIGKSLKYVEKKINNEQESIFIAF